MARLDRLCSQDDDDDDDDDDGHVDKSRHEQRAKLFEWVFGINYNLLSHSFSISTLRLIKDTGTVLYNRMNTDGYKESQDDIQALSGIAEDIRDALVDYQVCSNKPHTAGVRLKLGCFDRWRNSRRYTTRTAT